MYTAQPKQVLFHNAEAGEVLYGGAAGGGKAVTNKTLIVTPFGLRPVSSLKVGDTVTSGDGTPTKVIGVYPQGVREVFEITFQDGAKIKVDGEHLWNYSIARKGKWRKSGLEWKVGTTNQLIELIKTNKVLIPLTKPVKFTRSYRHDYRKIHPYVLGVLLGDGHLSNDIVSFTSVDEEIIEKVFENTNGKWSKSGISYNAIGSLRKELIHILSKLNLYGCKSNSKFIPEQYKYWTVENRFELLRGLMDTDGTVNDGKASFTSVSEKLVKDVQWLVRSLGGRATITSRIPKNSKTGKTGQRAYRLYIRMPDNKDIFYLSRKKNIASKYKKTLKRAILSIKPAGKEECTCIRVDHPSSLFVATHDFIVTHNTFAIIWDAVEFCLSYKNVRAAIFRRTFPELEKS
ncbi:MAG: hypothetical protein D6746_02710, partial [Bacteroidetes bacterium]